MCTVIVGFDPGADTPLVIAALRDEMSSRPWDRPARHWPDRPDLVGGRDRLAGGTWLAVDPTGPRTAALLNGWPWDGRMPWEGTYPASRGELPLRALAHAGRNPGRDPLHGDDPTLYAPFHLLDADAHRAGLRSWDGRCLDTRPLPVGVSMVVNTGLDPDGPRAARHTPEFARTRPDPADLSRAKGVEEIWGEWPRLVNEAANSAPRSAGPDESGDPTGLVARADLGGGRTWETGSVTLLAMDRETVRYAFTDAPADPGAWRMVDTSAPRG
ncbi:NRDE family protein [Nocardiopsis alborubida]|uniref:NRDE family protein n=1 Tax=Nocardiopsis alborubida TaxID=146802 RepID=A0A7X6RTG4_9ACTN|nr:NRDE family protein [Nocardiopsis alborubida]NKZ01247.1 NRDE family protein [Nocardiopsis alborubida]